MKSVDHCLYGRFEAPKVGLPSGALCALLDWAAAPAIIAVDSEQKFIAHNAVAL